MCPAWESNQRPFALRNNTQPTDPGRSGPDGILRAFSSVQQTGQRRRVMQICRAFPSLLGCSLPGSQGTTSPEVAQFSAERLCGTDSWQGTGLGRRTRRTWAPSSSRGGAPHSGAVLCACSVPTRLFCPHGVQVGSGLRRPPAPTGCPPQPGAALGSTCRSCSQQGGLSAPPASWLVFSPFC